MPPTPTPAPLTKAQKAELREALGEAIHTAFRKAGDHPNMSKIWRLINGLPHASWASVLDFIVECL